MLGSYRSVFRGSGLEFDEVREYEPGDDVRSIDWNVTARMGVPYIKKYREERELTVAVAVDVSGSSWFGSATSKRDLAADVAALLALSALHSNDRVALLLFSDHVERFVPPAKGRDHVVRIIRDVLLAEPRRSPTSIGVAARFLAHILGKRSVVFVLSDFIDSGFERPLHLLARRHDVVAVTLTDPREVRLPAAGLVHVEDAESGAVRWVDTSSAKVRDAYAELAARRTTERHRALARIGVDQLDLHTDRPYVPAFLGFFGRRLARS